jgi:hypothetical protein
MRLMRFAIRKSFGLCGDKLSPAIIAGRHEEFPVHFDQPVSLFLGEHEHIAA